MRWKKSNYMQLDTNKLLAFLYLSMIFFVAFTLIIIVLLKKN